MRNKINNTFNSFIISLIPLTEGKVIRKSVKVKGQKNIFKKNSYKTLPNVLGGGGTDIYHYFFQTFLFKLFMIMYYDKIRLI